MSAEETVGWLVQEVNDLLEASSVGLHEFLELLDEPDWPLSSDEGRNIARRALETIVSSGGVDLR